MHFKHHSFFFVLKCGKCPGPDLPPPKCGIFHIFFFFFDGFPNGDNPLVQYPHCRLTFGPRWTRQWEGQPVRDSGLQEELQTYFWGRPSEAWGKCPHYLTQIQELRNNALNNWPIRILQLIISERTTKQLAFGQLSFLRKHTDLTALVPCPTAQWTLKLGFAIHAPRLLM